MPFANGPGPRIYYETRGADDAPWLVMIRGLTRSLLHWKPVVDELSPHFRLLLVDNRGVGRSASVKVPFSTLDMANDVIRAMDAAHIDRAHVFGMSLGGLISQRLVLAHPHRVDKLVLGCTSPGGVQSRPNVSGLLQVSKARFQSIEAAAHAEGRLCLSKRFYDAHPEVVEHWVDIARTHPVSRTSLYLQLLAVARHRTAGEVADIKAPTLVLSSDADTLVPPSNSQRLAELIPGAELAWICGAGHDFATEAPTETTTVLKRFLLGNETN
jgi:3-oxoadipate enol-lactonase